MRTKMADTTSEKNYARFEDRCVKFQSSFNLANVTS
jgi:hypothetical protein